MWVAQLTALKTLEFLELNCCQNVTNRGAARLMLARTDLQVACTTAPRF